MLDFVKSQQFCVKWNSYSSNLQSVFPRLLNSEHFVDITLACEGQMIKCHKVVLSACSTYFEKLLVQNPCQHPIIFMKDMKHWEVQALVDFMYRGEVNVSQEELNSLLVAAEALQIRGLCGSDNANRQQEGVRQPSSPLSKIPAVSLPNDIELSGGTSLGHESPPQKKRKIPGDEKDPSQSVTPRISSVSGSTLGADSNVVLAPSASSDQFRTDGPSEDVEEDLKDKRIKQEVETDDNFLEGDGDGGVPDDEAGVEQQEDSDSNNREDVHSNALLDQPGPSGIATTGPAEKAATGGRWAGPVSTMVSSEVDHCGLPTLQHLSSFNQSQLLEIPFASSWRGNVGPALKHFSNQPHLQLSGHSGKLYPDIANIEHGQIRVRECFPSSVQLEGRLQETDVGINRSIHHYSSAPNSGTALDKIFDSPIHTPHSVRPVEVNMIPRNALMDERSRDLLLDPSCQVRQHRISRRRTEEEKALRKLEMARLRQRRFRAKIRLMREAGLPVIKRERKRKPVSERETDNNQS
ncbi:hypothetical protein R5R35_005381 [Gryllus longicercus]|uniref:BTB domain-containing protein n=1 Tax=Gryllus longicercus TaxID=2509291 RepID=A0AAN9VIT0_9ORTH